MLLLFFAVKIENLNIFFETMWRDVDTLQVWVLSQEFQEFLPVFFTVANLLAVSSLEGFDLLNHVSLDVLLSLFLIPFQAVLLTIVQLTPKVMELSQGLTSVFRQLSHSILIGLTELSAELMKSILGRVFIFQVSLGELVAFCLIESVYNLLYRFRLFLLCFLKLSSENILVFLELTIFQLHMCGKLEGVKHIVGPED